MPFQGNPVDDLDRESEAPDRTPPAALGEETVIKATAVPETAAPAIESHAGNQSQVYFTGHNPRQAGRWLQDVAISWYEIDQVLDSVQRQAAMLIDPGQD